MSDEVELLKKRLEIAEAKLEKKGLAESRSKRIGVVLVGFGVFFILKGQLITGLLIILIGTQFIF